jgi:hypothetical protein
MQPQLPARQSQFQDLRAPRPYTQLSGVKFSEHPVHTEGQRPIVQPRPASARPSLPQDSHASQVYTRHSGVKHSVPAQRQRPILQARPASAGSSQLQDLRAPQAYTRPSRVKFSEHPMHAQDQLPRHSLDPSQMAQSRPLSGQSSRVPLPRQSPYSSALFSHEEEGDISDGEEESDEIDDEEEEDSDDYDEEVDSDNPINEDDEEKGINGVINSTSGTPFSLTELSFGEVSWAELEAKSPETALFAEKSAYVWMEKCQKKAAQNNRSIAEYRLAGRANMGVEELLILEVQEYGRRAQEKWIKAVNTVWERNLRQAQPLIPEQTALHNASNVQRAGERLGPREQPQHMGSFRSAELRDLAASSNPKTKDGRGRGVPRDIFKHLESFVRERKAAGDDLSSGESGPSHPDGRPTPKASPLTLKTISQLDPVIGETSRLPPPAIHGSSTPVPPRPHPMHPKLDPVIGETPHRPPLTMRRGGTPVPFRSHPMHASSAMWYDIDEEAIAAEEETGLRPWDSVPHEYERPELPHNDANSVRSSAFMLAEEGGEQYRQGDEQMSYNEDESDCDSDISSESSITMTEASAHLPRSDQLRPSNIGQSAPRTVNAGGTNSDQPSARRSAWRTTQSIPKSMIPADIRSKSSTTKTTAAGQQDPRNASQYTPAGALNSGFNRPSAQRPVRMMQGLPKFRMF